VASLRWAQVTRVRYSQSLKWFRIEAADGAVVRVSAMLTGLPQFAQAVLAEVPEFHIDKSARPVLERTAAGFPPPIWM
jgi:hypothetical protein